MVIKIQKDHFYAFLADTEICVISNGTKDTAFFSFLTPFFQEKLLLISCMISNKLFFSLTMVAMDIGKKFFTYHRNRCYESKMFQQKLESYKFKLPQKN